MSDEPIMDTVTLTVDGQDVTVPKGTTILEAIGEVGTEIPHYCYHPGLSSPAICRLCLVEVEGAPKLLPSCVTQATDGQVVHTESENAAGMRRGVLEFYLVNHPLDCPVCDQSGECKLQDYVFSEGRERGRSREPKRIFGRDDFGGDVLFYGDRCVMCTRCVRFMDEIERKPLLTVVDRGNRSVIDTFFDRGLEEAEWGGNVVDICPVGALVSKDFLHKARAWDLKHTPSVCGSCSQGCNIDLHTRDNLVHRIKPRFNADVNGHWMCDYGRANYEGLNRSDRVEEPTFVRDGRAVQLGWDAALEVLEQRLAGVTGGVKAVVSASWSNEDLCAVAELVESLGGGEMVFRSARAESESALPGFPSLARRRDLVPNIRGAELLGMMRVGDDEGRGGLEGVADHGGLIVVLGDDLADQDESFGSKASLFVYLGAYASVGASAAHFTLPVSNFAEQLGTFTNHEGLVQQFLPALVAPGSARPASQILSSLVGAPA